MKTDLSQIADVLKKIKSKDIVLFKAVEKKILQISSLDYIALMHFKNLRGELSNYKRVHVGSFVLMFRIEEDSIIFVKFVHHDEAY